MAKNVIRDRAITPTSTEPLCPGKSQFLKDAQPRSEAVRQRITAHRARINGVSAPSKRPGAFDVSIEEMQEGLEKVHLEPNFLPVSFLAEGSEKASAVCRIRTSTSFGTGFLVARGILMTNNHVIPTRAKATGSVAEFDFEDGKNVRRIVINPDRIFITNRELDYTIVGCDDVGLDDIEPIPLLRNPALITEMERVSVIQHPRARRKEVSLHDNRVSDMMDRVLRYRTDTEPGSSGSPVFNNEWDLVALHHAGEMEADGTAENEGILISAIVNDLTAKLNDNSSNSELLSNMMHGIAGTSPFMGFFDTAGLFDEDHEVQVDSFTGDRNFADVGFWNIEHFNDAVSDERISRVADVFKTLSLDVFALTEVQNGALQRLVDEMSVRGFDLDFVVENVAGSQDIAVVFDSETTMVTQLEVDHPGFKEKINGKSVFPRVPLFARCVVEEQDGRSVEFIIVCVHLKAFGDRLSQMRRRRASEIMVEVIDELREESQLPVVFGGDFNERLTTDVLAAVKSSPDLITITADDAQSGAASYIGSRKSLIDHIVLSDDVQAGAIDGDDAAIVRLDRSVRDFSDNVSDHVPIVLRMVLAGEGSIDPGEDNGEPGDVDTPGDPSSGNSFRIPRNATKITISFE